MTSNKILGPETGYVDLLLYEMNEKLQKEHAERKPFSRTPIRPSSSGKCARELYFEMMEYAGRAKYETEPMKPETDLLLNLGHSIESHLIYNIRKYFTICQVKYTQQVLNFGKLEAVNDKQLSQHLEGSIDLCLLSDKWKCCVDVKSKGDYHDFKARKTNWDATSDKLTKMSTVHTMSDKAFWVPDLDAFLEELNDPFFAANFKQLNLYMNSDFIKDRGIDHAAIIQYHKSRSRLREVRFAPSAKLAAATIQKFQNVINAVDTDNIELAPAEYEAKSFKSRYCTFCQNKVPGSCAVVNAAKEEGDNE